MAQIIDGKAISKQVREEIAAEVVNFKEKYNAAPGLAVIIVGNDPASQVYVRNKKKGCEEVGFYSESYELPESTTQVATTIVIILTNLFLKKGIF